MMPFWLAVLVENSEVNDWEENGLDFRVAISLRLVVDNLRPFLVAELNLLRECRDLTFVLSIPRRELLVNLEIRVTVGITVLANDRRGYGENERIGGMLTEGRSE